MKAKLFMILAVIVCLFTVPRPLSAQRHQGLPTTISTQKQTAQGIDTAVVAFSDTSSDEDMAVDTCFSDEVDTADSGGSAVDNGAPSGWDSFWNSPHKVINALTNIMIIFLIVIGIVLIVLGVLMFFLIRYAIDRHNERIERMNDRSRYDASSSRVYQNNAQTGQQYSSQRQTKGNQQPRSAFSSAIDSLRASVDSPMSIREMRLAVRNIAFALILLVLGVFIDSEVFIAIGFMVLIWAVGQIVIAKWLTPKQPDSWQDSQQNGSQQTGIKENGQQTEDENQHDTNLQ